VMRMISRGYLPLCVKADSSSPRSALDVTSKKSEDGKVLQLQVVNVEPAPVEARIALTGFAPQSPLARVVQLSGGLEEVNTAEEPRRIEPRESRWRHQLQGGVTRYTFPGHSFTVIRLE
jgi:alpha-L-arabinofuranosidase